MALTPSSKELNAILISHGIIDFVSGGRLTLRERNLLWSLFKKTLSVTGRVGGSVGMSTARAAVPLVTNPYIAGTALGLGALQTEPGQQLLEAAAQSGADTRRSLDMALFNIQAKAEEKVKRTKSKFNSAVSKGMKAVKNSTSYGKKGVISAPKKAFAVVVSVASKLNKAKKTGTKFPKAPKLGVRKQIYKSMLGLFK